VTSQPTAAAGAIYWAPEWRIRTPIGHRRGPPRIACTGDPLHRPYPAYADLCGRV